MSVQLNLTPMKLQQLLALLDNLPAEKLAMVQQVIQRLAEQFKLNDNPVKAIELQLIDGQRELLWSQPPDNQPTRTKLGRELWKLRAEIVASGEPLLDWSGIEQTRRI